MKKLFFLLVTLFTFSLYSCNPPANTPDDIEGTWRIYKSKSPNSSTYIKVNYVTKYTFENSSNSNGIIEIYSESTQQTLVGNYKLDEDGSHIELTVPQTLYTGNIQYELDAGVGLMRINSYSNNVDLLLIKE